MNTETRSPQRRTESVALNTASNASVPVRRGRPLAGLVEVTRDGKLKPDQGEYRFEFSISRHLRRAKRGSPDGAALCVSVRFVTLCSMFVACRTLTWSCPSISPARMRRG